MLEVNYNVLSFHWYRRELCSVMTYLPIASRELYGKVQGVSVCTRNSLSEIVVLIVYILKGLNYSIFIHRYIGLLPLSNIKVVDWTT